MYYNCAKIASIMARANYSMSHHRLISVLCVLVALAKALCFSPYLETYPDPSDHKESTSLYFGLMMSLGGTYSSSGGVIGVQVALDEINNDDSLLPGYTLHYTLTDSKCDRRTALDSFFQQIFAKEVKLAWLGSGCSEATEPTAEVSHYYNITQISCQSSSSELENRYSRFRNYFQLLATDSNLAHGFYAIIQRFGWRRVTLIVQEENLFTVTMTRLKNLMTESGVNYTEKVFESKLGISSLGEDLFDPEARIYILSMHESHAKDLLCEAYRRGLRYPRYLFLLYAWYRPKWWVDEDMEGCTSEERESVLPYALGIVQYEFSKDYDAIIDAGMTGTKFDQLYEEKLKLWPLKSNYSVFKRPYDAVCYDATFALAYALSKTIGETNVTLEDFTYQNSDILKVISRHLQETSFDGLTGKITFNNRSERDVRVYQYRYVLGENGEERLQQVFIADAVGTGVSSTFVYVEGSDDDSVWPGGIPYDGSRVPIERHVSTEVTVVLSILATGGIAFSVVCLFFNFAFRNRKLIRLTSPNLNYIIGAGAIVLYMDVYFFVVPSTNPDIAAVLCNITPWMTAIGYSLCIGPILGKMVRIYLIFDNQDLKRSKWPVHDHHLGVAVLLMVLLDIIILLVYMAVEGTRGNLAVTQVSNRENPDDMQGEAGILVDYFIYTCSSDSRDIALGVLYGYKALLHVGAIVFAFQIRKVKIKGLNDAKYIAMAIYVTSIILACIIVSTYSLRDYVNAYATVFGVGFVIGTTMVLALVFVPKMIALKKDPHGKKIFSKHHSRVTLEPKVKAKRREIETLQKKIKELENILSRYQNGGETSSEVTTIDFSDYGSISEDP